MEITSKQVTFLLQNTGKPLKTLDVQGLLDLVLDEKTVPYVGTRQSRQLHPSFEKHALADQLICVEKNRLEIWMRI